MSGETGSSKTPTVVSAQLSHELNMRQRWPSRIPGILTALIVGWVMFGCAVVCYAESPSWEKKHSFNITGEGGSGTSERSFSFKINDQEVEDPGLRMGGMVLAGVLIAVVAIVALFLLSGAMVFMLGAAAFVGLLLLGLATPFLLPLLIPLGIVLLIKARPNQTIRGGSE